MPKKDPDFEPEFITKWNKYGTRMTVWLLENGNILIKSESNIPVADQEAGQIFPYYEEMTEERFLDEYRPALLKFWEFEPNEYQSDWAIRATLEDW